MTFRRTFRSLFLTAAVIFIVAIVAGSILGQPILLSYVTSDSMEPALEPGDGFVAIPTALAGPPSQGDVVVYRSEGLRPGEFVTHRIVDRQSSGYVTKGDGNPFPDQSNGEPPVPKSRIEAVALSYDSNVVVIPGLGSGLMAINENVQALQRGIAHLTGSRLFLGTGGTGYVLLAVGLLLLGAGLYFDQERLKRPNLPKDRSRPTLSIVMVILFLSLLIVGPATVVMTVSSGEEEFSFVSSDGVSSSAHVVRTGTTTRGTYNMTNTGTVPIVVFFESQHERLQIDVQRVTLAPGESVNATVAITAPDEPGYYKRSFVKRWYFAFLPSDWIEALHESHPILALAGVNTVIVTAIASLVITMFGRRPIPIRHSSRQESVRRRLQRLFQ